MDKKSFISLFLTTSLGVVGQVLPMDPSESNKAGKTLGFKKDENSLTPDERRVSEAMNLLQAKRDEINSIKNEVSRVEERMQSSQSDMQKKQLAFLVN